MAVNVSQAPISKKVASLTAATTTGASAAFSIPFADSYTFYLNVTAAGQTSTDTVFQTSVDGGTTYVNVPWRFAQVTTATGVFVLDVSAGVTSGPETGAITSGNGAAVAGTGGVLALQSIVDPRFMKFAYTISGTSPAADLYVITWPRGTRAGGVSD